MLLFLHRTKALEDLQDKFNECFPHLQIFFYRSKKDLECGRSLPTSETVGTAFRSSGGVLELKSWFTTRQVQDLFRNQHGVYVRLLRVAQNDWREAEPNDPLCCGANQKLQQT